MSQNNSKQFPLKIETLQQAKERNETKIMAFRASKDKTTSMIADKLIDCSPHHHCNLLACSVCLRKFRLRYLKKELKKWKRLYQKCPVYYITCILRVPVNPKTMPLLDLKRWFSNHIAQYGFDKIPLVGGVDYSINYDDSSEDWYICQHFHFLIALYKPDGFIQVLRFAFPKSNSVVRPIRAEIIKDEKGLIKALNYTIPAFFEKHWRRIVNQYHRTKHYPLGRYQLSELYRFLAGNKPKDLMISTRRMKGEKNEF